MNKNTAILSVIALLLIVVIGVGVWTLVNRQSQQTTQQDTKQQTQTFTVGEIASHNSKDDCWTVISGDVYDLTKFINRHPGGDQILQACGTDGTTLFTARQTSDGQSVGSGAPHSKAAQEQLERLKIGTLIR